VNYKNVTEHAPDCDLFDFDPDQQLGSDKPCSCGASSEAKEKEVVAMPVLSSGQLTLSPVAAIETRTGRFFDEQTGLLAPDQRSERERMTLRSLTPELDSIFVPEIDFLGAVVKPGHHHERSFAFSRECRVQGLRLPKGLVAERVVLRVGPRFRPVREDGQEVARYEGEDCLVFLGAEEVRRGEWKKHRLVPELQGALYLLVRNVTTDDLKFEGTILLQEDKVPTPEHEEL
jgi:hypothetical protein